MVALPLVVLLFVIMVCVVTISQDVAAADVVLEESTALAVKAAANQYSPITGEINFQRARKSFEKNLRDNFELKGNLEPRRGSLFADQPQYVLIIYNGFSTKNRPAGMQYEFRDGVLTETEIAEQGFPIVFDLSEDVAVELESPGAVAVVSVYPRQIFHQSVLFQRWAAAQILDDDRGYVVVLQKSGVS